MTLATTIAPPALSTSPARITVAHSGKQHAYRHALAVHRLGRLHRFVTSSYYKPRAFPDRLVAASSRLDRSLRRRHEPELPAERVVRHWRLELPELIARRLGCGELAERLMFHRDAAFDAWVAHRWVHDCDLYWGFQGSCHDSLRAARDAGVTAVAEFATAHVTRAIAILSAEAERHPEWAATISNFHFPDWYRERLEQEPHAADCCVVASRFSRDSLLDAGVPEERIRLLPLGVDVGRFTFSPRTTDGPLRILFVGGIGQRKGIKYLLEAVGRLRADSLRLILVGPLPPDESPLAPYRHLFEYRGRLDQAAVAHEMHQAHVLVLPSVFEGFGLVIPEAMATGMPVIASTHSIGPEMIRDGVDGFVLPPDDVDGLAARLEWFASHRRHALDMGAHAAQRAREFTWDAHRERLAELLAGMPSS